MFEELKSVLSGGLIYDLERQMRAIDLYAGIGGWRLGLELAGIEVVGSYEWWKPAVETHNGNAGGAIEPVDIRKMDLATLPSKIELVVGSPPCTEFSYANRGGKGDLAEGLKDLVRFFEIVDYLKPRFWAMENVPRVADLLKEAFDDTNHPLYNFRHLQPQVAVVDFSEFGTPQARRRCIATNIPLERIWLFQSKTVRRTLGEVVSALSSKGTVCDPVWDISLSNTAVSETEPEEPLGAEELRMNREAKEFHPVYNNMAFPDKLDEPARTVTATCTRVSRESIVIDDPLKLGAFRRLSIRERASLQGFPITYQFYGKSFSEKAKMIGNAIPPTFTYLVGLAAQNVPAEYFRGFKSVGRNLTLPRKAAPVTKLDSMGRTYPTSRAFRAALPGLRFKSGMRFDMSNTAGQSSTEWRVRFYHGSSKDIQQIVLDGSLTRLALQNSPLSGILNAFLREIRDDSFLQTSNPDQLQAVWSHRADGPSPFDLVDHLGKLAQELHGRMKATAQATAATWISEFVVSAASFGSSERLSGRAKIERNALWILSGIIVADWFNTSHWHKDQRKAA